MDGFFFRLLIILAFLVLTVFMITALTASMGKLIGHTLAFKSILWGTASVFLVYLGVAYIHSLSDFFFKLGILVYIGIVLYYFIKHTIQIIKSNKRNKIRMLGVLFSYIAVLLISIALINTIMIPMQVVSSILLTHLIVALMVFFIVAKFPIGAVSYAHRPIPSNSDSSMSNDSSQSDNSIYGHQIYGGVTRGGDWWDNYWYDNDGHKYEETSPGKYKRVD